MNSKVGVFYITNLILNQNLGMSELLVSDHGIQTIKNSQIHCFDLILPGLRKRRLLSSKERFRIKVGVLFFILVLTTTPHIPISKRIF